MVERGAEELAPVQEVCGECEGRVQGVRGEDVQGVCGKCAGSVRELCGECAGSVQRQKGLACETRYTAVYKVRHTIDRCWHTHQTT